MVGVSAATLILNPEIARICFDGPTRVGTSIIFTLPLMIATKTRHLQQSRPLNRFTQPSSPTWRRAERQSKAHESTQACSVTAKFT